MTRPAIDAALKRTHSPELIDALLALRSVWDIIEAHEAYCDDFDKVGACRHVSTGTLRSMITSAAELPA
jgi:hypothetical protein